MGILNEVLRKLTTVFPAVFIDGIRDEFFLKEQVACVSDVLQYLFYIGVFPSRTGSGLYTFRREFPLSL